MKRMGGWFSMGLLIFTGTILLLGRGMAAEKKEAYLLMGDVKEGWKVFYQKKCVECHSIWGEGGKGGPDLGALQEVYVSQSQLAALMWNHSPEMWGRMMARKIPILKFDKKEMADLFSFLYFIRYMDEPGNPQKGKTLMESKGCTRCHTVKEGTQGDLSRWTAYTNPILWAEMMWNHAPQMEQEMKKKGIPRTEFRGNEMVDLISYIRTVNPTAEKIYLSPGDPQKGATLFRQKGCIRCHGPKTSLDLSRREDFPRTPSRLAGMMWNHSFEMWKEIEQRGMPWPSLSSQDMADVIAYLFSTRYFDEPGDANRGRTVFVKKQCNLCHDRGGKGPHLSGLKGQISPIFMAQTMWNHGPQMLEEMRQKKVPWQKIDGREMVDLMEFLNQGTP